MDKRKAIINITTSVIFKLIILVVSIFARRYLVNILGTEATGIYSLYISIIGFLSIAELGIGTAITFSMYKPIVDGDKDLVSGLYYLYKKTYSIIFILMLITGIILTPFLPYLMKDQTGTYNIYITYLIFLAGTLVTYFYAYKTSFIEAHLDKYVTTTILSVGKIFEAILQIIVLLTTKSFILFLSTILISNTLQWIATQIVFKYKYSHLINENKDIPVEVREDVVKKTKAMFFHKIGGLLVVSTDSIIISAFVGISLLGIFSNYTMIATTMVGILVLIFKSIISIIGHSYAKNTKEVYHRQFKPIYLINYILALIFFLGFYATVDNVIGMIYGKDLIIAKNIVLVISLNYFISFMRQATMSFKDAAGLFYHDRYKPLLEGVVNLILSLIFVFIWGIAGVLMATIITNIFITSTIEPYVLYKHGFEKSPKKYYVYNYGGLILFLGGIFLFNLIPFKDQTNQFKAFLINGFTAVGIAVAILLILYIFNKEVRKITNDLLKQGLSLFKKK